MGDKIDFLIRKTSNLMKDDHHYDSEKGWKQVYRRSVGNSRRVRLYPVMKYAACFIILCGIAMYFLWNTTDDGSQRKGIAFHRSPEVELILANGERISLTDHQNIKVEELGIHITRDSTSGQMEYQNDLYEEEESTEVQYNYLKVPKGADFNMKLPDGSIVNLNSESILRFPVKFSRESREVYLEGEAFFDIVKNEEAPFTVYIGNKSVTVLGTQFNISAYPDDKTWVTTLVQGKISFNSDTRKQVLLPSEQLIANTLNETFELRKVDTDLYTSWMDGKYHFKGYRFEDIMKKMERWYDFELVYQSEDIKDMKFRGTIDKYRPLEKTLQYIEESTNYIHFKIDGKTVIVSKLEE